MAFTEIRLWTCFFACLVNFFKYWLFFIIFCVCMCVCLITWTVYNRTHKLCSVWNENLEQSFDMFSGFYLGEGGGGGGRLPLWNWIIKIRLILIIAWQSAWAVRVCICNEIKSLNESLHSNPPTDSIPHVNYFFQITISEFFVRFNDNFH